MPPPHPTMTWGQEDRAVCRDCQGSRAGRLAAPSASGGASRPRSLGLSATEQAAPEARTRGERGRRVRAQELDLALHRAQREREAFLLALGLEQGLRALLE